MTISEALSEKVQELLYKEGWTQREFAAHLGVTQGTVSYLLKGKRRQGALDFYERLARIFGVPLSVLFRELEARVYASGGEKHMHRRPPVDLITAMRNGTTTVVEPKAGMGSLTPGDMIAFVAQLHEQLRAQLATMKVARTELDALLASLSPPPTPTQKRKPVKRTRRDRAA